MMASWPWERPHEQLEALERAEIRLLRHIIENQRGLGRMLVALAQHQEMDTMALIDDIAAAAEATGVAATAAANRVIDTINENNALLAGLQAHNVEDDAAIAALEAEIAAGTVTPEAAQAVLDILDSTKATLDSIDATPVEPIPTV